jgi:uncharacterized membrane protein YcaP (DUF421 family)
MSWLLGQWQQLGTVAAKTVLLYIAALVVLRLGERRTLAQWTLIDFAAAVAVGAIVGKTATSPNTSWVTGAVALAAVVAAHRVNKLADHRIRVLVADGRLRRTQLRLCGLTDNDIMSELRQRGIFDLADVRYLIYETKGGLTVVRRDAAGPLVDTALTSAVAIDHDR